ncbi:MAG: SOS response-associated peptidase [Clostridia bacterium]|nr:SOS response-associated peptidase [Clostridia bacterium]
MCGRFYIESDDTPDELIELLNRAETRVQAADPAFRLPRGEVRPGDWAAVVSLNRASQKSVFAMKWGFRMDRQLLINARSETAALKPTFRDSMVNRRCLIPASAYFEWDHRTKPLTKYRFALPDSPLLWLAGLYRFEADSAWPVFTVLTRPAAEAIAPFHDRMPIILPPSLHTQWLDRSCPPQAIMDAALTQLTWRRA